MASMRAVMFRRTLHMPCRASLTSTSRTVTHSSSLSSSRAAFHHAPRRPLNDRFRSRLGDALNKTKIQWKPIPIGLGIGFLGLFQFYRTQTRENDNSLGNGDRPSKRERVKPDGPWQVQVMSTLPLKAISRLWGRFNEIPIPYYLRIPGFKLYSWIFGVNLDEVAEPDLHVFPNLASFFYRKIKDGSRPLDPSPDALISPADGRVLQFGKVVGGDIEQVKGMTYSVDALLGTSTPPASIVGDSEVDDKKIELHGDEKLVKQDEEFAQVNGISYTIPDLIGGSNKESHLGRKVRDQTTRPSSPGAVADVRAELALGEKPWYDLLSEEKKNSLYYAVVYLAPGDYHRFHSPANWVVERRRHFAGELYSVSPYLQRTLPGLFTLNERVALIGRWRWGFFSYVPVGATNVGSIVVNFDEELRTNSLLTDTEADRAAAEAKARGEPYSGFAEATYSTASRVLGGHALRRGDEMGGFKLGSTIVLVFEAPAAENPAAKGGFRWAVEMGQKVKMGQALGYVEE